jgi:hypothetical protein
VATTCTHDRDFRSFDFLDVSELLDGLPLVPTQARSLRAKLDEPY